MFYERFAEERREEPTFYCGGWDRNLPPGIRYGPVIRDIYIVECCTGGYGSVVINGTEFSVGPGDCYILFPGDVVIHTADFKDPRRGVWCAVDGLNLGEVFTRVGISSSAPFAPKEAFDDVCALLEQMLSMQDKTDPGADFRRTGCVYAMLGTLLRYSASATDKNRWIKQAVGIMETRYHEPLSVGGLAKETGLDRSYFSTLFHEQMGMSPHEYLTSLRIRKACALLRKKDLSVGQVAASVGLDACNFSRLFKKEIGKTPKEYRDEKSI